MISAEAGPKGLVKTWGETPPQTCGQILVLSGGSGASPESPMLFLRGFPQAEARIYLIISIICVTFTDPPQALLLLLNF